MAGLEFGKGNGINEYCKKIENTVPQLMQMFMVEAYRRITVKTPVDTGRARFGYFCSVNAINRDVPPEAPEGYANKDPITGRHVAPFYTVDHERALKAFMNIKVSDSLYIANSVPYIIPLNNGRAVQMPARFQEAAFEESVNAVRKYLSK